MKHTLLQCVVDSEISIPLLLFLVKLSADRSDFWMYGFSSDRFTDNVTKQSTSQRVIYLDDMELNGFLSVEVIIKLKHKTVLWAFFNKRGFLHLKHAEKHRPTGLSRLVHPIFQLRLNHIPGRHRTLRFRTPRGLHARSFYIPCTELERDRDPKWYIYLTKRIFATIFVWLKM